MLETSLAVGDKENKIPIELTTALGLRVRPLCSPPAHPSITQVDRLQAAIFSITVTLATRVLRLDRAHPELDM